AEIAGAPDTAEGHRTSRPHRDRPERDVAELVHHLLREVGLADRNAARRNDRVGTFGSDAHRVFERFGIVAYDAHVDDVDAEAREHRVNRVAIAVVDLACG